MADRQVRSEQPDELHIMQYADEIGVSRRDFLEAFNEVPVMSLPQFNKTAEMLSAFSDGISEKRYNNYLLNELLKSKQIIEVIIDSIPARVFWKDKNHVYIGCNQAFANDAGFSDTNEIIGKNDFQMQWRDRAELYRSDDSKVLESGCKKLNIEELLTTAEGKTLTVITSKTPLSDVKGEVNGILGVYIDITERKQTEEELYLQAKIVDNMAEGVFLTRITDGIIVYANPAIERMFGASQGELTGKHISSVNAHTDKSPDDIARDIIRDLTNKGNWSGEVENLRLDGTTFRSYAQVSSFSHPQHGKVWVAIHQDITERKKAEVKLWESEKRTQRQREALALLAVDESLLKSDLNEGFCSITELISSTIGVEKASIWIFSEDGKNLDCIASFEASTKKHISRASIQIASLPNYFNAIRKESRIHAFDAQNDPRTAELRDNYLNPLGITSILEAGILIKGRLAGVVCLGSIGNKRKWEADEEAFVSTVASIISQALMNSERIKTEEMLQESEQKFREVFNSTNEAIFIDDALTGKMIDCNDRTVEMYGYNNKEEILQGNIGDLSANIDPYNEEMAQYNIRKAIEIGNHTFDWLAKKKNGDFFWAEVSLKTTKIGGENRVLAVVRDISERKQSEEALRENEEMLRTLFDNSPIALEIYDRNGIIRKCNKKVNEMFGLDSDSLLGNFNLKNDPNYQYEDVWNKLQRGEEVRHEIQFNFGKVQYESSKKGLTYYDIITTPIPASLSKSIGYIMQVVDITDRRKAEDQIKESEEKLMFLFENMIQGVVYQNANGEIIYANEAAENILGLTFNQMKGVTSVDPRWCSIHEDGTSYPGETHPAMVAINTGQPVLNAIMGVFNPQIDDYKWININSIPRFNPNENKPFQVVTTFEDITKITLTTSELIKAKERAEESDRLKSAFLANMSHEIRTPMNGILGFANLLKEPDLTREEMNTYIGIIEKSGDRLLNIINDLINISKIEAGQMEVAVSATNINEQIEFIYTFFKPEVEKKGMKLFCKKTLPADKAIVNTDCEKIYAILTNLVKNAIKYSYTGSIEFGYDVNAIAAMEHAPLPQLQFYVKDTGIGIPSNRQEAIFERFVQADISDKMARQGAGLGLSISKAYVEMLGGKIWVESEEGKGSTFYFTIPYKGNRNDLHRL